MSLKRPFKGILGLGSVSTQYYLKEIHRQYNQANEEFSTCPLVLYQIDFQELNPFLPNDFSTLIPKVKVYLEQVSNLGITKLLVPNITLHETLDQIEIPFEICHPVISTLEYLRKNAVPGVYIFGTSYTMNSDCLKRKFEEKNIDFLKPSETDQKRIDGFRKKVYEEKATSVEIKNFQNLIQKYSEDSTVVIACTELCVFSPKENLSCIDMIDLQIKEFLK